jgi:hypothetical protein
LGDGMRPIGKLTNCWTYIYAFRFQGA